MNKCIFKYWFWVARSSKRKRKVESSEDSDNNDACDESEVEV